MRRLAATVLLLACACAGCGDADAPTAPAGPPQAAAPVVIPPALTTATAAVAPPPRLPDPRTVRRALRRALLAGHLIRAEHDRYRRAYRLARTTRDRLGGAPRAELGAVLEQVRRLARTRMLSVSRMELAFTLLERNAAYFQGAGRHNDPTRVTFRGDPLVFRHYPGHGIQLQPLASAGRAAAAARTCLAGRRAKQRCRPAGLRRLLDRLLAVAAPRRGGLVWEGWFSFGGAQPGWISGMTQGVAAQALARGGAALDEPRYLAAARRAVRPFTVAPPAGVAVRAPGGRHFLMYSTKPGLRILNGHLQAVTGLRDAATLGAGRRAWLAFRRGDGAARAALRGYDTGAWSLYSAGGAEANLGYHRLMRTQLDGLCRRTDRRAYCGAGRRFARYLTEPPRIEVASPRRVRLGRDAPLRFSLSKVSHVTVRVAGRRGWSFERRFKLTRGRHSLAWHPPRRGRYRVTVSAAGLSGPRAQRSRTVVVRKPKAKRKRKPERRRRPSVQRLERQSEKASIKPLRSSGDS